MTKMLNDLFSRELFLKRVDKFDQTTLQNIYSLSREKAESEMEKFQKDGFPKCFAVVCSNCYHICKYGTIEKFQNEVNQKLECDYCFHVDVLSPKHPGLYTFLFNENAQGLKHNPEDSLEEKINKSFNK